MFPFDVADDANPFRLGSFAYEWLAFELSGLARRPSSGP
jgi:hypothetical protein